jgi:hypothetical protein
MVKQKRRNAPHSKCWREYRGALNVATPLECGAFAALFEGPGVVYCALKRATAAARERTWSF